MAVSRTNGSHTVQNGIRISKNTAFFPVVDIGYSPLSPPSVHTRYPFPHSFFFFLSAWQVEGLVHICKQGPESLVLDAFDPKPWYGFTSQIPEVSFYSLRKQPIQNPRSKENKIIKKSARKRKSRAFWNFGNLPQGPKIKTHRGGFKYCT